MLGLNPYIIGGVFLAVVLVCGFSYYKGYSTSSASWSQKYELREAQWKASTTAEISRQAQANAMAKALEQKQLQEMEARNTALEQKVKELNDAADKDPDANKPALSDSARMRIDSVH